MWKLSDKIWWGPWDAAFQNTEMKSVLFLAGQDLHHRAYDVTKLPDHVRFFKFSFPDSEPLSAAHFHSLVEIIKLIQNNHWFPLLVQCRAGQERSMATAILAEKLITGASLQSITDRAKALRPDGLRHKVFQDAFRDLCFDV